MGIHATYTSKYTQHRRIKINFEWLAIPGICIAVVAPLARIKIASGPIYLTDILMGIALFFILSSYLNPRRRLIETTKPLLGIDKFVLSFLILILPSGILSLDAFGVLPVLFVYGRVVIAITSYFVLRRLASTWSRVDFISRVICYSAVISAGLGIVQIYFPDTWRGGLKDLVYFGTPTNVTLLAWDEGIQSGLRRAFAGFLVPTAFGGMLSITFYLVIQRARSINWIWWLGAIIIMISLFNTWSRQVYPIIIAAIFCTISLTAWLNQRNQLLVLGFIFFMITILLFLFIQFDGVEFSISTHHDPLERLQSMLAPWNDSSFRDRIDKYPKLIEAVLSNPQTLLTGFGHTYLTTAYKYTNIKIIDAFQIREGFASNSWLLYLHNYGVPAFIAIIIVWLKLFRLYTKNFLNLSPEHRRIAFYLCCTQFAIAFAALSDNYVHMQIPINLLTWAIMGLFVNVLTLPPTTNLTE